MRTIFPTSSIAIITIPVASQSMFEDRIEFSPLMRGGRNYWQESSSLSRISPSLPSDVPHVNRYQARLVTCGNRDNYNVSAEFRYGEGGTGVMVEPPPLSRGPSGGNSTLTLAPLPGNHPQSVFQSAPLLFNYPFKACNLLLCGTDSLVPVISRRETTRTMMTSCSSTKVSRKRNFEPRGDTRYKCKRA